MNRVDKGDKLKTAIAQPGRTIIESADGTLEGQVVWKIDSEAIPIKDIDSSDLLPMVATNDGQPGDPHPDDDRLECYARDIVYGSNGIITCTASYFGIETVTNGQTDPVLTFSGGISTEPIETHPDFAEFGGTPSAPLNGATFDADTGEFLSFTKFEEIKEGGTNTVTTSNYHGIDSYLVPLTNVTIAYWQDKAPVPKKLAVVYNFIPGVTDFRKPEGVKNFLLINQSIRQVGNFYEITEEYFGSGPDGWNETVYDTKP